MRKIKLIVAVFLLITGLTAHAESRPLGLGLILGQPSGLTLKYFLDQDNAFDIGLAYSFGDAFIVYGDYHWYDVGFFGSSTSFIQSLAGYLGFGVVISSSESKSGLTTTGAGLGFRIPVGAFWRSPDRRFEVFLELAPGLMFVPRTFAIMEGGLGARFYF